jgi:hypothetical protein
VFVGLAIHHWNIPLDLQRISYRNEMVPFDPTQAFIPPRI